MPTIKTESRWYIFVKKKNIYIHARLNRVERLKDYQYF